MLHFEFLDRLGARPGETPAEKVGRLIAFYAEDQAGLPASQSVADPFVYWKAAFTAWVAREAAPVKPVESESYDQVWQQILQRIETKVNRHTFYTWFRPLKMVSDYPTPTGRVIEVAKPGIDGGLFVAWVEKHYGGIMQAAVDEVRPGSRVEVIDAWAAESETAGRRERESTG